MAYRDPRFLLPLALVLLTTLVPLVLARHRMRKLFHSGDVHRVLESWRRSIERVMYPETMAPLMIATAYASYGWTEAARGALGKAHKGPAWDAALEQRLFVETLLDTFEGDAPSALAKATALMHLPVPRVGLWATRRVTKLRDGVVAMVRAFQHSSLDGDTKALREAAKISPLVHWAMRYAEAIVAIDHGSTAQARALLDHAPEWPKESAFRSFDDEIRTRLAAL
jgi:hypothetical protein